MKEIVFWPEICINQISLLTVTNCRVAKSIIKYIYLYLMVNVNKERLVLAIPIAIWRAYDKSVDSWMQHSESVDEIKENSKMITMII